MKYLNKSKKVLIVLNFKAAVKLHRSIIWDLKLL